MENAPRYLKDALRVIVFLQSHEIDPVLYGSVGVSLYIGQFKTFDDIDFLIKAEWLNERWLELISILGKQNFILIDKHEHEFKNSEGIKIAFADEAVLLRDGIASSLDEVVTKTVGITKVRTLTPQTFKRAYIFSEKDGYRQSKRKKDSLVIKLLSNFI
jgi:hypothetical protein